MDSLYNRYAGALISVAEEENKLVEFKDDVKVLLKAFNEESELEHLFSSCALTFEEKEKVIEDCFAKYISEEVRNFLKIIIRNRRTHAFKKIAREFIKLANERLGIKEGIAYSVDKLSEDELHRIESKLSEIMKVKVELTNMIDERLIGGVKVVIEDKIFDGSIKNKIESLRTSLIGGNHNGI